MVSDDKVEVDLPDITAFMNVSGRVIDTQAETLSSSNLVRLPTPATGSNSVTAGITHPNPDINLPALTGQRNIVGSTEHSSAAESPSAKLSTTNFLSLVSRSVPNAKSHLVAHTQTPSPSPLQHLSEVPRPDRSHKSVPIIPDWTQWASSHCTPSHRQNSSWCCCLYNIGAFQDHVVST